MKVSIIACKTIENEINYALRKHDTAYPVHWIEPGLHNYPDQLHAKLVDCINDIDDCDYIIMFFGICGNALLNLGSQTASLVIPKVDDCISLLLGGNEKRREMESTLRAYYLTQGWMHSESSIWREYQKSVEEYGPEKTKAMFKIMFKNYTHLLLIETKAYDVKSVLAESKNIARTFGLEHSIVPGDLRLLSDAVQHNWSTDQFAIIGPGKKSTLTQMSSCSSFEFKKSLGR